MTIIDLEEVRRQRKDLNLVWYDEEEGADVADLIHLTVEGGVVVLTHPKEMKGVHLSVEQAQRLGLHLIRASVNAEQIRDFAEEDDPGA